MPMVGSPVRYNASLPPKDRPVADDELPDRLKLRFHFLVNKVRFFQVYKPFYPRDWLSMAGVRSGRGSAAAEAAIIFWR